MRKLLPADADARFLARTRRLSLWFCLVFPLVAAFGLNACVQGIYLFLENHPRLTDGARLFWEICLGTLDPLINFARIFFLFFAYGIFVLTLYRFGWKNRHTWAAFAVATGAVSVYPLSSYLLVAVFAPNVGRYDLLLVTYNVLLTFGVEFVIFLLLCGTNYLLLRKEDAAELPLLPTGFSPRSHPLYKRFVVMVAVQAAARLGYIVYETVENVIAIVERYGGIGSFGQVLTLMEPYFLLVLYSFVGYFTLVLLATSMQQPAKEV